MLITRPCRMFLPYWRGLRCGGETVPVRSALDPADIPHLLPQLIVYDVGATAESVIYRLVGTAITIRWGYDPTGRRYADVVGGDEGWRSARAVVRVVQERAAMRMVRRHRRPSGRYEDIEICCLPVWDDRRNVAQAVTVSAPLSPDRRCVDADTDPVCERVLLSRTFFDPDNLHAAASGRPDTAPGRVCED